MFHPRFTAHLEQQLADFFQEQTAIYNYTPVHGGDINQAFMLETGKGKFLVKVNAAMFGPDMFEKEARGLVTLADTGCIKVPRPLFDGKYHQQIFLVMEYIDKGTPAGNFWDDFGKSLACLHHHEGDHYGLGYPNYTGRLVQPNDAHDDWAVFYAQERILNLSDKAAAKGLLDIVHLSAIEKLTAKFADIFPVEKPSLLHGDLWSGNFMVTSGGQAAIYDPAIYYGHREMDIAMTLLFGGFDREFYDAYHYHYPLQSGWKERVELCQLYPLLVHLLLFGGHYRGSVIEIIRKYTT
jgi:fructosamine-3-kinase